MEFEQSRALHGEDRAADANPVEWSSGRMWAICFDLKQDALERYYPGADIRNAYGDIRRVLERHGFTNQQGSVYFGKTPDHVSCVLAVQEVQSCYPWFRNVVRDIRTLRIEENSDLRPAIGQPELPFDQFSQRRPRRLGSLPLN